MNKTAMQLLIAHMEQWVDFDPKTRGVYKELIEKATELLPTERQQIEDAHREGYQACYDGKQRRHDDYFTTTYKTS